MAKRKPKAVKVVPKEPPPKKDSVADVLAEALKPFAEMELLEKSKKNILTVGDIAKAKKAYQLYKEK